jgi:hypothetical protein
VVRIFLGLVFVVVAVAIAVTALLLVRRRAPEGGFFTDGDRAAGVFGVLATGFSVMLGFVVFLAFESFDQSRTGASEEALVVSQQFETAQFLPVGVRARLSGELVCYGRSVVYEEWPRMEDGTEGDTLNPWASAMFRTLKTTQPVSNAEQAAYQKWLDQTSDRELGRSDRLHGAQGVLPAPLWAVLFFTAGVILVFMLFFADRGEHAVVQAVLIGSVVAVLCTTLLVIRQLDSPYHTGPGGLQPTAMKRALVVLEEELTVAGRRVPVLCDASGRPLATPR